MNWHALAYCAAILVVVMSLLVLWAWPRHRDGKLFSLDETEELLDRFPRPPDEFGKLLIVSLFVTIAMIGVALTSHDSSNHHDE